MVAWLTRMNAMHAFRNEVLRMTSPWDSEVLLHFCFLKRSEPLSSSGILLASRAVGFMHGSRGSKSNVYDPLEADTQGQDDLTAVAERSKHAGGGSAVVLFAVYVERAESVVEIRMIRKS